MTASASSRPGELTMGWDDTLSGMPLIAPGSVRRFGVAIAIPEPYSTELRDWRKRFGDAGADRIVPHVTLLTPTDLHAAQLPQVEAHLAEVAAGGVPFRIELRGADDFRPVSPVVFVPLTAGGEQCFELQGRVRSGPLARDLRFPYHPHVTIAHECPDDVLDMASEMIAGYDAAFDVWGFSLFECGPDLVWRPYREFPFGVSRDEGPVRG